MVIGSAMSGDLGDAGHVVRKICDGTGGGPVFGVLPRHHRSAGNEAFIRAGYGDVLSLDPVRVRFNPDREAINLLLTAHTRVSVLAPSVSPCTRERTPTGGARPGMRIHMLKSAGDKSTSGKRMRERTRGK
jgi:hypothetical protein